MTRVLTTLLCVGLVVAMSAPVSGQSREVRRLVEDAKAAFDEEEFEDAAVLLEQAYELQPVPFIMYNVARAYEMAGSWDLAEVNYLRFSDLDIPEEDRALALDRIARYEAARSLPLVLAKARSAAELDTLRASNRQLREGVKPVVDDTDEVDLGRGAWSKSEVAGWASAGLGVACLGTAFTLHLASIGTVEEYNATAAAGRDRAKYDAFKDTLNARVVASEVFLVSGLLLAGGGAALLYFEYFAEEGLFAGGYVVPVLTPGGGAVTFEARF
jgi:hypothetical protein